MCVSALVQSHRLKMTRFETRGSDMLWMPFFYYYFFIIIIKCGFKNGDLNIPQGVSHHSLLHKYSQAVMLKKKAPGITQTGNTIALLWLLLMNYFNFERKKTTLRTKFKVIIMILSSQ